MFTNPVTHTDLTTALRTPHVPISIDAQDLAILTLLASIGLQAMTASDREALAHLTKTCSAYRSSPLAPSIFCDAPVVLANHDARLHRFTRS